MRAVFATVLLVGCHKDDCGADCGTGTVPGSSVTVEGAGVVTCADPGLRSASPYVRKQAPATRLDAANLAGGGLVIDDLDADGRMDLFIPSEDWVQLWWGQTDDPLYDQQDGIPGVDLSMAVGGAAVDFDADGDLDLLVTRFERPVVLLRNEGNRVFVDATAASGLGGYARKYQSASWGDLDRDGDLDLFLGTYGEFTKINVNEDLDCTDHHPDPSELWRNDGDGTFTEISALLPDEVQQGYVFASGWYDIDGDGFPELFVSNDDGLCAPSVLLRNGGGSAFTVDVDANFHPESHDMGMAVGDLNGDDLPDFALTSYERVSLLRSSASNGLWIESGLSYGLEVDTETAQQIYGWGAEFADVDNDADLDLAMNFGYWSYYDGALDEPKQADGLWLQEAGQFSDHGTPWGVADSGVGRGLVFADLNNDGFLDLVKRQLDADTPMYVSHCGAESWLRLRLRDSGANPYAVGARVRVVTGANRQLRWMQSGSSGMYSGSPLELHFGLGDADTVDQIEVLWPDGELTVTDGVDARQVVTLTRQPS